MSNLAMSSPWSGCERDDMVEHLLHYYPYPFAMSQQNCRPGGECGASEDGGSRSHPGGGSC